jgi:uncharacterized protein YggT (Ycf19 family)
MSLINLILDVAALLLWLSWRSVGLDTFAGTRPATLAGTLRRAEPARVKRWHFLAAVAALLVVRASFYWQIAGGVNWTPKLDLFFVTLPFRDDVFASALLFSVLSFARTLLVFYFWLLALAMINGRVAEPDPIHKLLLLQLGRPGRWPRGLQATLPVLAGAALWIGFHPLLVHTGTTSRASSVLHLVGQGLVAGSGIYLTLKFLLPPLLFLHLLASYVYLGGSPVWDFIATTARNLLAPLSRLPLHVGRVDFAPLAGIVLILLLLHALPEFIVSQLSQRNLTCWPQ